MDIIFTKKILGKYIKSLRSLTILSILFSTLGVSPSFAQAQGISGLIRPESSRDRGQASEQVIKVPLAQRAALPPGTPVLPATLIRTFDTSNLAWSPSSPDPSGVDYWPPTGGLIIVDSEVDEMPNYFTGKNVFLSTLSGVLTGTCTTTPLNRLGWSNEPTGVAVNPNNNHIFISDDDLFKVFEVNLGADRTYCTADDTVTSVNTTVDTEDVAYGNNTLFIAGGAEADVVQFNLGSNGVLGGGDDGPVSSFDTAALGFSDLEGIGYNADHGTLFIVSTAGADRYLGEVTPSGTLLRAYDLSFMGTSNNIRSDVAWAPSSQNPAVNSIYIVSRGLDNELNSRENDGKAWEISIGASEVEGVLIRLMIGGNSMGDVTVPPNTDLRSNYAGLNSGPVKVVSINNIPILTSERFIYSYNGVPVSYSEMMGYPRNRLATQYYFPWYNNVAMDSQLRVSNLGDVPTTINVYLGTHKIDSYILAAGSVTRKNYTGKNAGPLKVTSSTTNILSSIRVLFNGNSYSEMMGYPATQVANESWYPVYDNAGLDSQLRVSNVGTGPTTITVYAGGVQIDIYTLNAGAATRKNYPQNTGPLHVVSSTEPVLSTIRMLYTTPNFSSYYEMMGLPETQLSIQYFFPWYNNVAMNSELRFAVP